MLKLLMSWDIKPGQEAAYFEFAVQELAPAMAKMNLHLGEAWYTVYGEGPQILIVGVADNVETMKRILQSGEWRALHKKLLQFVDNYSHKIVRASNRFQM